MHRSAFDAQECIVGAPTGDSCQTQKRHLVIETAVGRWYIEITQVRANHELQNIFVGKWKIRNL
jgi:hypothetical protein